jgi:hypothetical protein
VRIIVFLNIIPFVYGCDASVIEFFVPRFDKEVWPLVTQAELLALKNPTFADRLRTAINKANNARDSSLRSLGLVTS